jgi:hypothetical protein
MVPLTTDTNQAHFHCKRMHRAAQHGSTAHSPLTKEVLQELVQNALQVHKLHGLKRRLDMVHLVAQWWPTIGCHVLLAHSAASQGMRAECKQPNCSTHAPWQHRQEGCGGHQAALLPWLLACFAHAR